MKFKPIKKVRAIIYDIKDGKPYFLILRRVLNWRGWEFLKETMEPGETTLQTIKRGIKEETKLKKFKILKKFNYRENWRAMGRDFSIVCLYVVRADMRQKISLKQDITEHNKYAWVDKKTALRKLTWPKTRKFFRELKFDYSKNYPKHLK
ncbi:MAG TPA: NUDIX hydrolase [Candidatus Paceibacterota bacterium]|nr:NUDIX hydrolase [Candidatus Paceibacterota bacterium]HRY76573.1 NUDIX hydrolase [Candidatus Paceibacterota bacterium]